MASGIDAMRKTIRAKDPVRPRLIHQLNLHSALTCGLTLFVRRAGESIYDMIADLAKGPGQNTEQRSDLLHLKHCWIG